MARKVSSRSVTGDLSWSESSMRNFLQGFEPLKKLSDQDLLKIYRCFRTYTVEAGTLLSFPGDRAHRWYLVQEGCLSYETWNSEKEALPLQYIGRGEDHGRQSLLKPSKELGLLKAVEKSQIHVLEHQDLAELCRQDHSFLHKLSLEKHWSKEEMIKGYKRSDHRIWGPGLLPQERILGVHRLHGFLRWSERFLPLFFMVSGIFWAFYSRQLWESWTLLWAGDLPALAMVLMGSFWLFPLVWVQNRNVLGLTNLYIYHRWLSLKRQESGLKKLSLSDVQSLEIKQKGLFNRLLGLKTLIIKTSVPNGDLEVKNLENPEAFRQHFMESQQFLKSVGQGKNQEDLRQWLLHYMGSKKIPQLQEPEFPLQKNEKESKKPKVKRRNISWGKKVSGDDTRYYKHPFPFWKQRSGLLALVLFLVFLVVIPWPLPLENAVPWSLDQVQHFYFVIRMILLGLAFVLTLRFLWVWDDWNNDHFLVSQQRVLDLDRWPLGLKSSRKEAPLENIQSITVEKTGWSAWTLDYGNLKFFTGGENPEIVFEYVMRPEWVQSEIFRMKKEKGEQALERNRENRFKEVAEVLEIYQQSLEQNLIPPRSGN